jgi:UDP-N-acetylmuramate dehydrogenase
MEDLKTFLKSNKINFLENEPLAKYTTWKVGGPADLFIEIQEVHFIQSLIKKLNALHIPYYILGGGSNVLISDEGFKGVVIKNSISGIEILEDEQTVTLPKNEVTDVRLSQIDTKEYYSFEELNYDESNVENIKVAIYSGTLLSLAINRLITNGITGLQWFAGIPGTIGGAVFNNIHGGTYFLSEFLTGVDIIDENGDLLHLSHDEMGFGYDHSKLQTDRKFILKAYFNLHKGDSKRAQETAIAWARAKKTKQPYNSAGCSFKNVEKEKMLDLYLSSNSWGYIIDHILKLKGTKIGQAMISNSHAAFIESFPGAKAEDIMGLLELIYNKSQQELKITPKTEIFFVGFPKERVQKFL